MNIVCAFAFFLTRHAVCNSDIWERTGGTNTTSIHRVLDSLAKSRMAGHQRTRLRLSSAEVEQDLVNGRLPQNWWTGPGGNRPITDVTLPSQLHSIEPQAFKGCKSLEKVVLCEGRTSPSAFALYLVVDRLSWVLPEKTYVDYIRKVAETHTPIRGTIGEYAFQECENLVEVRIPHMVDTVAISAFQGCTSLMKVSMPAIEKSTGSFFRGCPNLREVEILRGASTIGANSFAGCKRLETVDFKASVARIGASAFSGCECLQQLTLRDGLTEIHQEAFSGCSSLREIEIPVSVVTISTAAFRHTGLEKITMPCGQSILANGKIFEGCFNLLEATILPGSNSVAQGLFAECRRLKKVTIPFGVITIAPRAFWGCQALCDVMLPDGLVSIGESAFESCTQLRTLEIPLSVESIGKSAFRSTKIINATMPTSLSNAIDIFQESSCLEKLIVREGSLRISPRLLVNCASLVAVEIPVGVTEILESAFQGCRNLVQIKLPYGLSIIGARAFDGCTSLRTLEIPLSVQSIGQNAFRASGITTATLPSSFSGATDGSLFDGVHLKEVTLLSGSISILGKLFFRCATLVTVDIPLGVTSIGASAFSECHALTDVRLPYGLRIIEAHAFEGCRSLKEVLIPLSVKSIGVDAFRHSGLKSASLPSNVQVSNHQAGIFFGCADLQQITILNGSTGIANGVFAHCTALDSVIVPCGVMSIGDFAFRDCLELRHVNLPEGLISIGASAFERCSNLREITIPRTVSSIGTFAFRSSGLARVVIRSRQPLVQTSGIFEGCLQLADGNGRVYLAANADSTRAALPVKCKISGLPSTSS